MHRIHDVTEQIEDGPSPFTVREEAAFRAGVRVERRFAPCIDGGLTEAEVELAAVRIAHPFALTSKLFNVASFLQS